ncbi:hypothetical protein ACERK3_01545 [Phycisphaerales bacterium AB-hyl4]|uniref:Uncharacterized protein n=1 Tax=Natronomicrosphaera hydrolytica TaxID=3242702 RepID=A0ABV4U291_9BACT
MLSDRPVQLFEYEPHDRLLIIAGDGLLQLMQRDLDLLRIFNAGDVKARDNALFCGGWICLLYRLIGRRCMFGW